MYKIFIKKQQTTTERYSYRSGVKALEKFEELQNMLLDEPAGLFLTVKNQVYKQYRLDSDWEGNRYIINDELPSQGRPKSDNNMIAISLNFPEDMLQKIDEAFPEQGFSDRSSWIRFAIMDYLNRKD